MSKKLKKRGISILFLLFFISNQGLNFAHVHFESEDEKSCQHYGNETHIHNKQTEKCAICQHNFHSSLFYFIPKTNRFFNNENKIKQFEISDLVRSDSTSVLLRGPPVLSI